MSRLRYKFYKLVYNQSISEEIANSITHGIGAVISIAALVILIIRAANGTQLRLVSFIIFGITLFIMFISSTLYHSLRPFKAKALFLKFDHIAIYLLIAGTYTPLVLITISGTFGWVLFGIIWGFALIGIVGKALFSSAVTDKLSLVIYLIMGWIVVIFIKPLIQTLPLGGIVFLFAGGLFYSLGTLFFYFKKIPFSHAIWHLFVIAGATCHFFCILLYVV